MGNRKERIENLEKEISQKQQSLNELKAAELRNDPDDDYTQEDIDQIVNDIFNT